MDKDRRVSIETISAQFGVSQCGNCTHKYSRGTEDAEDLRKVCPKGAQRWSERKTLSWPGRWPSWSIQIPQFLMLWWPATWIYCYDPETKRQSSQSGRAYWLSQAQEGQTGQIHTQTFDDSFFDSTHIIYKHWGPSRQSTRNTMLRF